MSKSNGHGYTVAIQRGATEWNLRCLTDNARMIGENISSTDHPPSLHSIRETSSVSVFNTPDNSQCLQTFNLASDGSYTPAASSAPTHVLTCTCSKSSLPTDRAIEGLTNI